MHGSKVWPLVMVLAACGQNVAGFDSEEESFMSSRPSSERVAGQGNAVMPCTSPSAFFDVAEDHLRPPQFLLAPGEGLMSLFQVDGENWNARISSSIVSACPGALIFYEQPEFNGRTLFFSGHARVNMKTFPLELMSWDNKARSIRSVAYFDFEANDTASAQRNTPSATINLRDGQTIQIGTCGLPGTTGEGDTFLRLFDARGEAIAFNDDSCGPLSFISYTVSPGAGGPHEIRAGCFGNRPCKGTVAYSFFSR